MVVYYVNSKGEKLNLMKSPYRVVDADWFDSDWEENSSGYERTVSIDVFGKRADFKSNMERLYKIIAVDSELGVYGKLYVNNTYLRCKIKSSRKSGWKGYIFSEAELVFQAPALEWIQEVNKKFYKMPSNMPGHGANYSFNYPYNYAVDETGLSQMLIDHVISSDFKMIIYGPCEDPRIEVNNYPYEVFTTLEEGEYLVIDSAESTITKYAEDGTTSNLFNDRSFEYSVFKQMPAGLLTFIWNGEFGFDLILYLKRREAKW